LISSEINALDGSSLPLRTRDTVERWIPNSIAKVASVRRLAVIHWCSVIRTLCGTRTELSSTFCTAAAQDRVAIVRHTHT
jgi:hypothetical protein